MIFKSTFHCQISRQKPIITASQISVITKETSALQDESTARRNKNTVIASERSERGNLFLILTITKKYYPKTPITKVKSLKKRKTSLQY